MGFLSSLGNFAKSDLGKTLISGGLQMYGASRASSAAEKAAKQQAASQMQAMQYQEQRRAPYANVGKKAAGIMQNSLSGAPCGLLRDFGAQEFQTDPGYQFRMDEGVRAIDQMGAAKGKRLSGEQLKAVMDYGQNMGSQEYQRAYDRYNTDRTKRYNMLAGPMQLGTGQVGQMGDYITNAGAAQSASTVASNNAWNKALQGMLQGYNVLS